MKNVLKNHLHPAAFYNALIKNSHDLISLADKNFKVFYRSPSVTLITDWSEEDLNKFENISLIHSDDKKSLEESMQQVLTNPGKPVPVLFRIKCKAGNYIWLEGVITNYLNDEDVKCIVSNFEDVTIRKEAEENLQNLIRELSDYKYALDESSIVAITDQKGIIKYANDNFCRISKFTREELIGKDHRIINSGYHNKEFIRDLWQTISNGKIWRGDLKNKAKDGSIYWVATTIIPFLNEAGKPYQYVAIRSDITKTKEAEDELINVYKEKETVLNRITDAVVSVNRDWRYTFLNDAAMATHPFERDEIIGKLLWDVHPELVGTPFDEKYHEAMNTGKVVEIESYYQPMDIWFFVRVYPSNDGLTIFYRNITESKKSEQELIESLREVSDYKNALDESSIVAITDQKGIIQYANDNFCKISKYNRDELVGQDHKIVNSDFHSEEFIKNLWSTIANGKIWRGDIKNKAKDGSTYWVETTIVPFLNEHGKPNRYLAIRADITQRKLTEEQLSENIQELERSNKELEQFAYIASHDLQEPLRMVGSYMQLIERRYKGKLDADADEFIHYAVDGAARMKQLIGDLLNYSRMNKEGKITEVDINDLIKEVLQNLSESIKESRAVITYSELPIIPSDRTQMLQLFQNLLSNAIKFKREDIDPVINISVSMKKNKWLFAIADNGIGIESEYLEKVFIIFRQLHSKAKYKGTGIGLAIAKKIVERHGGKIWFESIADKGTTFYFTLNI